MDATLYDRLGGEAAVDAAVELFYRKVLGDARLGPFFDGVDMDAQQAKQKRFLTMVFGGPNAYTGKGLRAAHAHLVAKGMKEFHFDAVAGHLKDTLAELGVPEDVAGEVMDIAGGARDDVLNR